MIAPLSGFATNLFASRVNNAIIDGMTPLEIIRRFGGPARLGRMLGIRSQAVSLWASKGRIPVGRVPQLERLARDLRLEMRAEVMRPDIDWSALRIRK